MAQRSWQRASAASCRRSHSWTRATVNGSEAGAAAEDGVEEGELVLQEVDAPISSSGWNNDAAAEDDCAAATVAAWGADINPIAAWGAASRVDGEPLVRVVRAVG